MNIAIGKFGKSILFNPDKWGMVGGDEAPSSFYKQLAKRHPNHNFYLIGKNDLKSKVIYKNLINLWDGFDAKKDKGYIWLLKKVQKLGLKFDCGIFFMGPLGNVNIPNFSFILKDNSTYAKVLAMFENYAAPMIMFLNKTNIPYFTISEDPRYIPSQARDLINVEKFALSQFNKTIKTRRIKSEKEITTMVYHDVPYYYSKVETIFMMNRKKEFNEFIKKKDINFAIYMHGNPERFEVIKEWFIDKKNPVKVYGDWKEHEEQYPETFIHKPMSEMMDRIHRTKYTLILGRRYSDFVTQKFWESIHFGIVPFVYNYDSSNLLPIPSILRVNSVERMHRVMKFLEDNPEKYERLIKHFDKVLDDGFYNGNIVCDIVSESVEKITGKEL